MCPGFGEDAFALLYGNGFAEGQHEMDMLTTGLEQNSKMQESIHVQEQFASAESYERDIDGSCCTSNVITVKLHLDHPICTEITSTFISIMTIRLGFFLQNAAPSVVGFYNYIETNHR